jgi:hypothetical protein
MGLRGLRYPFKLAFILLAFILPASSHSSSLRSSKASMTKLRFKLEPCSYRIVCAHLVQRVYRATLFLLMR